MSSFVVRTSNIHQQQQQPQQQSQQISQQRYTATVFAGQNQQQQSYNNNSNYPNQYSSIGVSVTTSTPASISNLTTNQRSSPSIQYSSGGFYRASNTGWFYLRF